MLNLLWVSHYHHTPIILMVIKKFLCLVDNGCMWLGEPIPITDMLIHRVTLLPHSGLNPAMAIGEKTGKHDLAVRMKDKFKLTKKPLKYSICSITDPVIKVATQFLARKIMRKCHTDEVQDTICVISGSVCRGRTI